MFSNDVLQGSDFDPIAFLKHTLHLPNIDTATTQLTNCVNEVDEKIKASVGTHFDEMLHQVDVCQKAAKDTVKVHASVSSLSSSCSRLSHTIEGSYDTIEASMHEVRNTGIALETLKAVHRIVAAVQKLPTGNDDTDISRCARRLRDVDELLAKHHDQVSGIHVIDAAMSTITSVSTNCRQRAHEMIRQGLLFGKHSDVIVALQSLSMLGSLGRFVVTYVSEAKRETLKSVVKLDAQSIATTMAEQTDVNKAKEVLFAKLDVSLKEIASRCQLISTLRALLDRQRDASSNTHTSSSDLHIGGGSAAAAAHEEADMESIQHALVDFSNSLTSQLLEKFARLSKKNNVNGVLITEYPRLYKCLALFGSQASGVLEMGTTIDTHGFLEKVLLDYEKQYIGNVSERHLDRIHTLISNMNGIMPAVGEEHQQVSGNNNNNSSGGRSHHSSRSGGGGASSSYGNSEMSTPVSGNMPFSASGVSSSLLAQKLDCRPLLKVISTDIAAHRQEPHLAYMHIRVATSTLRSVHDKLNEGVSRVPGSYAPDLTIGQLFHLNLANCAAYLHNELISVVGSAAGSVSTSSVSIPSSSSMGGGSSSSPLRATNYRVPTPTQLSNTTMQLRRAVEAFGTFQRRLINTELVDGGVIHVWAVAKRLLVSAVDAKAATVSPPSSSSQHQQPESTSANTPPLVFEAQRDLKEAIHGIVARLSLLHRVGSNSDDARRAMVSLILWKGIIWCMLHPDAHDNSGLQYGLNRISEDLCILLPVDRFPPTLRKVHMQLLTLLQQYRSLETEEATVSTKSYIHHNLLCATSNAVLRLSSNDLRNAAPGASSALKSVYLVSALHHLMSIAPSADDAANNYNTNNNGGGGEAAKMLDSTNPAPTSMPLHTAMSMSADQVVEVVASWVGTSRGVKDKFKLKMRAGVGAVIKHAQQSGRIPVELLTDVKVLLGECVIDIDSTTTNDAATSASP